MIVGVLKFFSLEYLYLSVLNLNESLSNFFDICCGFNFGADVFISSLLSIILVRNIAFVFVIKLMISIMLLILVRGGTPRYRYDYLTKLGWLKFFGLTITFFLTILLIYFLF